MSNFPSIEERERMAKESPEELEALFRDEVERIISGAPLEQQRILRGVQFKIDAQKQIAKNPYDSMIRTYKAMFDSLNKMREVLNEHVGKE